MSGSTIVDVKQVEASANYSMRILKQLKLADQIVEIIQELPQCGGGDEMLEQYKKCSAENKKCFENFMELLADYINGLLKQKALASQIVQRVDAGEFAN